MSYNYTDYNNYYNNHNIRFDPNFEDNMLCCVNMPQNTSFDGTDSLKFVKCKDFLNNNPSYQLTIARQLDSQKNTPFDCFAVMPNSYISPASIIRPPPPHPPHPPLPIIKDDDFFNKILIAEIPKNLIKEAELNMSIDQRNIIHKIVWDKASDIYCKYQPDYNSCTTKLNSPQKSIPLPPDPENNLKSKNNKNSIVYYTILLLLFLFLFYIIFLIYKYLNKK